LPSSIIFQYNTEGLNFCDRHGSALTNAPLPHAPLNGLKVSTFATGMVLDHKHAKLDQPLATSLFFAEEGGDPTVMTSLDRDGGRDSSQSIYDNTDYNPGESFSRVLPPSTTSPASAGPDEYTSMKRLQLLKECTVPVFGARFCAPLPQAAFSPFSGAFGRGYC
jgi:hypothetical protein